METSLQCGDSGRIKLGAERGGDLPSDSMSQVRAAEGLSLDSGIAGQWEEEQRSRCQICVVASETTHIHGVPCRDQQGGQHPVAPVCSHDRDTTTTDTGTAKTQQAQAGTRYIGQDSQDHNTLPLHRLTFFPPSPPSTLHVLVRAGSDRHGPSSRCPAMHLADPLRPRPPAYHVRVGLISLSNTKHHQPLSSPPLPTGTSDEPSLTAASRLASTANPNSPAPARLPPKPARHKMHHTKHHRNPDDTAVDHLARLALTLSPNPPVHATAIACLPKRLPHGV